MSECTKTTVANVIVAFACCTIAVLAFLSHRARGEDRLVEHRASIQWHDAHATPRDEPADIR